MTHRLVLRHGPASGVDIARADLGRLLAHQVPVKRDGTIERAVGFLRPVLDIDGLVDEGDLLDGSRCPSASTNRVRGDHDVVQRVLEVVLVTRFGPSRWLPETKGPPRPTPGFLSRRFRTAFRCSTSELRTRSAPGNPTAGPS